MVHSLWTIDIDRLGKVKREVLGFKNNSRKVRTILREKKLILNCSLKIKDSKFSNLAKNSDLFRL